MVEGGSPIPVPSGRARSADTLSEFHACSVTAVTLVNNSALRFLLLAMGWLWVGIAFVGAFLPGIPFTGPIILAAYFFSKSSERFDQWLLNSKVFGPIVRDWREGNGFTVGAKITAVVAIMISFGTTTLYFLTNGYVRAIMWAIAAGVIIFILTRPMKRSADYAEVGAT